MQLTLTISLLILLVQVSSVAKEKDDKDYESGTTIVAQANQTYTGLSASGGQGTGIEFTIGRMVLVL